MLSWLFFLLLIIISLAVDLGLHRKKEIQSTKHALYWSFFWILLALAFNGWIYLSQGSVNALNFLAGYLVEKALSVDNLFVFLLIFRAFSIPRALRHKVLFWGIFGAFVMRTLFIIGGISLLAHFSWIFYVFGGFLIYTGFKLAIEKEKDIHPEKNPLILWIQKWMPVSCSCESGNFFEISQDGHRSLTPLFLALIAVEISDLIFALDSIPAILGITTDPFIVLSSNIFAILGLRSLYFALEGVMDFFHYLHYGLSAILIFIGIKMLVADFIHIPIAFSLLFIILTLTIAIFASLIDRRNSL